METQFELTRVASLVRAGGYERVALQFPDELVGDSVAVSLAMSELVPETKFFILADNTFASTDPDEVAAQHVQAQAIVLYGRASLNPSCRLPVIFVFGQLPVNVDNAVAAFGEQVGNATAVLVLYDVIYAHAIRTRGSPGPALFFS